MDANSEISFNPDGFDLSKDLETQFVAWAEIVSVFVYKKDVFTIDLICMEMNMQNGQAVYLDEDMTGWKDLVDFLPEHLPECMSFADWFMVVAFPPFEAKPTRIFCRADRESLP